MVVDPDIRKQVDAKIAASLKLAEQHFSRRIRKPVVIYTKRGSTAGTATFSKWEINLNPGLLIRNVDQFIERTVPHELAHLIADLMYPQQLGKKRDVHGDNWKRVCRILGMTDVSRCHSYDVSEVKLVRSTSKTVKWQCTCGKVLMLSPRKSASLDAAPMSMWHSKCKGQRLRRYSGQSNDGTTGDIHPDGIAY